MGQSAKVKECVAHFHTKKKELKNNCCWHRDKNKWSILQGLALTTYVSYARDNELFTINFPSL